MSNEIKSDKERYSTITIEDEEVEEDKTVFSKTIEIPKIMLQKASKNIFKSFLRSRQDHFNDAKRYNPDPSQGLSSLQVNERQLNNLVNKKIKTLTKPIYKIIFNYVFTFFNILLWVVGIFLITIKHFTDLVFLLVISLNTIIGIIQEIKAKKEVDKLSLMATTKIKVKRDSLKYRINSDELVLDDIYYLEIGEEVPADSYILHGVVEVNESSLTGESLPVRKTEGDYILAGSYVVSGAIKCKVDRIGTHNYIAQLQQKAAKVKKVQSILLKSINRIIRFISAVVIPVGFLTWLGYYLSNSTYEEIVSKTGGQIVALIPSGLFLLISIAFASSVYRLSKKNAMVQDSYAIESLARTNVLCLDKTGTITDGSLLVKEVIDLQKGKNKRNVEEVIKNFLNAFSDENLTSKALIKHYGKDSTYKIVTTLPFSSARKLSAVEFANQGTFILGAPEFVLDDKEIIAQSDKYLKEGYRVLVLASNEEKLHDNIVFKNSKPLCFFVMEDHIREEAPSIIKWFNENDVEVRIISGDNPLSVSQIAKKVGIKGYEKYVSLDGKSNEEVAQIANDYSIFGRVSPEQKAVLIKAIKDSGKTVAMTGDGVNDILAMKQANCSIAIASGSEAARNAAHIVLMDSNFSSMPSIVQEGRQVVNNVQRSSSLFLMKTFYAMIIACLGLINTLLVLCKVNMPISLMNPFDPKHLYIIEFFIIGAPSLYLSFIPNNKLIQGSFLKNVGKKAIMGGIFLALSVVLIQIFSATGIMKFDVKDSFISAACVTISFTGLILLLFVCLPLDKFTTPLYVAMVGVSLFWIYILPTALTGITAEALTGNDYLIIMLYVALVAIIYVVDYFLTKKKNV